ncbi:hypothetical protein KKJ04_06200 [Xenorhabdus bovienii]|uniref:hypothetical protein n=1 Tax=Xenorhabdus bovienii TaxID=40576 RepID=UPI0023B2C0CC|nr:hypothetical protein [Xenorhabdus bovienii]MDE9445204.1 hypothetical protein [Xenorhabdus bovienii]
MKILYNVSKNSNSFSGHVVTSRGLESEEVVRTRNLVRKNIERLSDSDAREGILSDTLGILLIHFSQLIIELTKVKTLEDIKSIAQPISEIFVTIDEDIKNGSLIFPYMIKPDGVSKSLSDMKNLSNDISNILLKSQQKEI